jgi:hypothetical protein
LRASGKLVESHISKGSPALTSASVRAATFRKWVRQDEADRGERDDRLTSKDTEELKRLRKENAELKRTNEILRLAIAFSHRRPTRPGAGALPLAKGLNRGAQVPQIDPLGLSIQTFSRPADSRTSGR